MSSARARWRAALWTAGALALAPACGWQSGLVVPEGVDSVGVEFFDNTTPERDLEISLADEIGRAVVDLVDRPLVAPGRSAAFIRGRVEEFRRRGGIRSDDNFQLETSVQITASAELVRSQSGEVLARARSTILSSFVIDDPLPSERDARARALRYIAEELVLDLFSPRAYKDGP